MKRLLGISGGSSLRNATKKKTDGPLLTPADDRPALCRMAQENPSGKELARLESPAGNELCGPDHPAALPLEGQNPEHPLAACHIDPFRRE